MFASSPAPVLQIVLALALMASPVVSRALQPHIYLSPVFAALRCTGQLIIMAIFLQHVLTLRSVWRVAVITRMFFDNVFTRMSFLNRLASVTECACHL